MSDDFKSWLEENETSTIEVAKVLYVAVMLTKESQDQLKHTMENLLQIPQNWKRICHHMTIRFKPTDESLLPTLGESVSLVVTDYAMDEKGVAVKVEPNTNKEQLKMPESQLPHITVAVAPGIAPVYSNTLLRGQTIKMPTALILHGFIGAELMTGGKIIPEIKGLATK